MDNESQIIQLIDSIKVAGPFEEPMSSDVVEAARSASEMYWQLSSEDRSALQAELSNRYSDFECRSIAARLTTVCTRMIDEKEAELLPTAIMLFDIGSGRSDWRENVISMAILANSLELLKTQGVEYDLDQWAQHNPNFLSHYQKAFDNDGNVRPLLYYGLKRVLKSGKISIVPIE